MTTFIKIIFVLLAIIGLFLLAGFFAGQLQSDLGGYPIGLLPNPVLTPGKADTLSLSDLVAQYDCDTGEKITN